jgi:hypothetical protein
MNDEGRRHSAPATSSTSVADDTSDLGERRPRYLIRKRDGSAVDAVAVEHLPGGWLRAAIVVYDFVLDDEANVARRVFDRVEGRRYPPREITVIVELDQYLGAAA